MQVQSEHININGASLYVTQMGTSNKEKIIFLHGGPGLGDSRADQVTFAPLADQYHVTFIDLRGCGKSSDTPPFTHAQWVEDIETLRKTLGFTKFALHGSSYGGFLVQEYAAKYPENVSHIALNVTCPDGTNDLKAIENAKQSDRCHLSDKELERLFQGEVMNNEDFRYLYAGIQPLYMVTADKERDEEKLNQIMFHYQTHNEAFRNLKNFDMKPVLGRLNMPALITAGEKDWITPPLYSEQIHELMPSSAYVLFKDYGHSLVREQSVIYLELLRRFLSNRIEARKEKYEVIGGEIL
ncbi:alpha/beta hydrolase [Sporosarcina sp. FSL W7-1349]|uniref:alpha/beta fold hydrolase n=1 Tax=Sporosarcina sp. FSL W7-1349 TaxID=2921561 RepID=UPI0030F925A2